MRLTIFQKGLLLVSVPLAFEIAFVAYLSGLLHAEEAQVKLETHAKDVILHVDTIRRDWTEAAFSATIYAYTHNTILRFKYQSQLGDIQDELQTCRDLCKNNPRQMKILDYIAGLDVKSRRLLEAIQDQPEPLQALFPMHSVAINNHPFVKVRQAADSIIEEEEAVLARSPAVHSKNKKQIEQALWGAIGFNVALTIFFTAYLARNITNRLQSVMLNTRKMVNREVLLPQVGGSDEIAELDRVLHRTADELLELEKFKRELTAMVTHELRTPLTSIQGVLTLMRMGVLGELPTAAQEKVQMAEINSQRLIRLINDLLDIEKMEAGKLEITPEPCFLQPIIDQSIEAVREFAEQHQINIANEKTEVWVKADAERVVQVVINFLSNAIKYSPKSGTVTVATSVKDNMVEVRVIDCGRGIPPEFRDRIFEKFEQVDGRDPRERKGTGLGLAICRGIIEHHEGQIGVDSEIDKGSTFWFTVPLSHSIEMKPANAVSVAG